MTPPARDSIFFKRESRRAYLDKPVDQSTLDELFEIIRWSPSSGNAQPWRIIFVRDESRKQKMQAAMPRGNHWALKAPLLVAVCTHREFDAVRTDDAVEYAQFDSGIATMSLLLGAVHLGLMAHPMGGYDSPGIKKALDVPEDWKVMCLVSLGYQGRVEDLDEFTQKKEAAPRVRKPIDEIIQFDTFGFALPESET